MWKILAIEDDLEVTEIYKKIFEGHEFVPCKSLHDAFTTKIVNDVENGKPFDVVILDLMLPKRGVTTEFYDPISVIKATDERFQGTPVVIISAFIDDQTRIEAMARKMICIDKTIFLETTETFMKIFVKSMEDSKKMRVLTVEDMTVKPFTVLKKSIEMGMQSEHPTKEKPTIREVCEALCYVFCTVTICGTILALLVGSWYSEVMMQRPWAFAFMKETLAFCGLCVAVVMGAAGYIIKIAGKNIKAIAEHVKDD